MNSNYFPHLALFLIFAFAFTLYSCDDSSDKQKVDCDKICKKLSECESKDDITSCKTFCNNMTEKKYFQDSYISKLIECQKMEKCEDFSKCGDELEKSCSKVDSSAFSKAYCEKVVNECKTYTGGDYNACVEEEEEQASDECMSTKFYSDMAECVKKLDCKNFNTDKCWEELVGISD
ncbi:MAG: hypothetical protein N2746_11225 [Deltaproteobacteria bacterium]|nr:hypothetical protein [Deltaproteobacteria bacterium]